MFNEVLLDDEPGTHMCGQQFGYMSLIIDISDELR